MQALDDLARAQAEVARELSRLLAPAGLVVRDAAAAGSGWRLYVEAADAPPETGRVRPETSSGAAPRPRANRTAGVAALQRAPGETLMALVARAGEELRVGGASAGGGIRIAAPEPEVHAQWLAGTLVGDVILALRYLGEPEDGDRAVVELHRQLRVFRQESRRLLGRDDDAPFLVALESWTPAGFPRGPAFLARGGEVVYHA